MPWKDLRSFLNFLEERGDIVRIQREVDRKYEVGYGMRKSCDASGPALLFENVKGYETPILGALYGARRRCVWALDAPQDQVHEKILKGMRNPIPPAIVKQGPCKEVIWTGENAELDRLPIPWISPKDGGYFINMALQIVKDPQYGGNISIHRCHVLGKNKLGLMAFPPQHLGVYYSRAENRGQPLEVALALGIDPVIAMASQIKTSIGVDAMAIVGGIRGQPIELVKCETIDVEVPATSEIVIEGRMMPNIRGNEGPFGEYTGYYGNGTTSPVVEVSAITMRENPIFHACSMPHENVFIKQIPFEAALYEHVRRVCPTVKAVHYPPEGGCTEMAFISIKQTRREEAKSVIISAFGFGPLKYVVVVDDDIDVYNTSQVLGAIAYRSQPKDDAIILPQIMRSALDPSTLGERLSSVMGIDATKPFGVPFPETIQIPEAETFEIPRDKQQQQKTQSQPS